MLMAGTLTRATKRLDRPNCKYGDKCCRRNPLHFQEFAHPTGARHLKTTHTPNQPKLGRVPSRRDASAPRHCKFGCKRVANKDGHREFATCCRACAISQGAGAHDADCIASSDEGSHGSEASCSADPEMATLLALDHALELWQQARAYEMRGDRAGARQLLRDFGQQLELASARMPRSGKHRGLVEQVVKASCGERAAADDTCVRPLGAIEEEVDEELDWMIMDLERMLPCRCGSDDGVSSCRQIVSVGSGSASVPASGLLLKLCRLGCGRPCSAGQRSGGHGYDTCCRACAVSKGSGKHDSNCMVTKDCPSFVALPRDKLVPAFDALGLSGEAGLGGDPSPPSCRQRAESSSPTFSADACSHPAQLALALLSLDDEWPTSLTMREIRRRYMCKALAVHPDKGPPAEKSWRTERFQELSDAYSILEHQMAALDRIRGGGSEPSGSCTTGESTFERSPTTECATDVRWQGAAPAVQPYKPPLPAPAHPPPASMSGPDFADKPSPALDVKYVKAKRSIEESRLERSEEGSVDVATPTFKKRMRDQQKQSPLPRDDAGGMASRTAEIVMAKPESVRQRIEPSPEPCAAEPMTSDWWSLLGTIFGSACSDMSLSHSTQKI
eukprot:TRINITY_DN11806_c0_g2_i1.p1 TRINITY_DN11806_c0_g2~~TRINITY_DN11806_c0_g2_i1.p1  ORF type:complete len:616 (+),score=82.52 TRINITY_DN11806_c0_g2_i1:110-1957(+)